MNILARRFKHSLHKVNPFPAVVLLLGLALSASNGFSQSGAGSIQGTVTDPTGAMIPKASVHAVNQGTNISADATTSAVGFYQVPGLFAGTYVVTISAPGFKTYKTTLQLLVAQTAVINASLTAGAVTQQIQVQANTVQLTTTDNGTINSTLESNRINQLP